MSAAISIVRAAAMGYSADKRKRRRQHRKNARYLRSVGGSITYAVGIWHLQQARAIH